MNWLNFVRKLWEPYTFDQIERFADERKNFLDLGAWVGPFTVFAHKLFNYVFAVECDPVAFEELKQNTRGKRGNIMLINKALCGTVGEVNMYSDEWGNSVSTLTQSGQIDHCKVVAIDTETLLRDYVCNVGLVKMDIEGSEYDVLPDMYDWLKAGQIPVIMSMHKTRPMEEIMAFVDQLQTVYKIDRHWITSHLENDYSTDFLLSEFV